MLEWLFKKTKRIPYSRAQDAFQRKSLTIIQIILQQKTLIVVICVCLLVIGAFFPIKQYYKEQTEMEAQNQLYLSTAKWDALKKSLFPTPSDSNEPPIPPVTEPKNPILKEEDYKQLQTSYEEVIQSHIGTKGAILAALQLAQLHINQGDSNAALRVMQQVEPTLKTKGMIDAIALMSLANLYADNQDCTKAIEVWSKVIESSEFSFVHQDALLKQGLCFEQMQNIDMAYQNYQKLEMDYIESPQGQMAQRLLSLMDRK